MSKGLKRLVFVIVMVTSALYLFRDYIEFEFSGPYNFIVYSDKDDVNTRVEFARCRLNYADFHKLLLKLLSTENRDLVSKEACILYIYSAYDIRYLGSLREVEIDFKRIGLDSVWLFEVAPGHYRRNDLRNAAIVTSLRRAIERLEGSCVSNH